MAKQKKAPRPNARQHQGAAGRVRPPKRRHPGTEEPIGYQGDHSDCPARPCGDFADDPTTPEPLRKWLAFALAPAHGAFLPEPHPTLFADYEGKRVRVTMASRLGDVGITADHNRDMGYEWRVAVSQLSNFSEVP